MYPGLTTKYQYTLVTQAYPQCTLASIYPHLTGGHKERIPSRYICKDLAVSGADAADNVVAHAYAA